jgi:hypothetical protein
MFIANRKGKVYFPLTKLIVGGDRSQILGPGFNWITSPKYVKGMPYKHTDTTELLARLAKRENLELSSAVAAGDVETEAL